ncbi:hypothetical protein FRX31_032344, partial [Thalictrum thalictroides]
FRSRKVFPDLLSSSSIFFDFHLLPHLDRCVLRYRCFQPRIISSLLSTTQGSLFAIHPSLWPLSLVPDCCRSIFWCKISIFGNFSMSLMLYYDKTQHLLICISLAVTLFGYCCIGSEAEKKGNPANIQMRASLMKIFSSSSGGSLNTFQRGH